MHESIWKKNGYQISAIFIGITQDEFQQQQNIIYFQINQHMHVS